jgi:hypothetical protein
MTDTGCNWTAQHNCPDQPAGTVGAASDDGTLGHACCCKHGLWKTQEKPTSASAESKWSKLKQNVKKKLNNFKARVFAQEPEAPQTPAAPEVPPAVNAPLTADDVSDQIPAPPKVVDSMRALMEVSEHKAEEARVVEDRTDALDTIEQKSEEGAKNAAAELAKADAQLQATAKDAKDEKQPAVQAWLHGSQSEAVQPSQHAQFEASLKGVASTLP